jgi:hypothetical protein
MQTSTRAGADRREEFDYGQDNLLTDDPQPHHEWLAGLGLSRRG